MPSTVTVTFARDREYVFKVQDSSARPSHDEAQQWLDREWSDLDCTTSHPLGKVLTLDKILTVAKYAGEKHFAEGGRWATEYARAVITTLERDTVHVDIAEWVVG